MDIKVIYAQAIRVPERPTILNENCFKVKINNYDVYTCIYEHGKRLSFFSINMLLRTHPQLFLYDIISVRKANTYT